MIQRQTNTAGRVAVVTGAGSGIGRSIAVALLQDGWRVALAGRRRDALMRTIERATTAGEEALAVPTDVTVPSQVNALFARVASDWGRLDLLVNNAGVFPVSAAPEDVTYQQWTDAVAVNLTGAFLCAQHAFRMMKAQHPHGGRIINNGSISAHVPRPHSVAYTATKHAITGLTRSLALDGRRHDIACGQIDVGNADTEMTQAMADGMRQADGSMAAEAVMDVDHVAQAVRFMASLPLNANVPFLTVMATAMPYLGRG